MPCHIDISSHDSATPAPAVCQLRSPTTNPTRLVAVLFACSQWPLIRSPP